MSAAWIRRASAAIAASALASVGCGAGNAGPNASASADATDRAPGTSAPTYSVPDDATTIANNAATALGATDAPSFSVTSSYGGVASWDVHLGTSLRIVGSDASGSIQAALVVLFDADRAVSGLACATPADRADGNVCAAATAAMAHDLRSIDGMGAVAPASLHVLDLTTPAAASCQRSVSDVAQSFATSPKVAAGSAPRNVPCASGSCSLVFVGAAPAGDGQKLAQGLTAGCCNAGASEAADGSLVRPTTLICTP